jgi:hypothetical protein
MELTIPKALFRVDIAGTRRDFKRVLPDLPFGRSPIAAFPSGKTRAIKKNNCV